MSGIDRLNAKQLASKGRFGDNNILHVSDREIAALDGIATLANGRPMSTNPDTGAKEAFSLTELLLTLGMTAMGVPPWLAGATPGLLKGDPKAALIGGLTSGMAPVGAPSAAQAAGQVGADAAAQAAGQVGADAAAQAAGQMGADAAAQAAGQMGADAAAQAAGQSVLAGSGDPMMSAIMGSAPVVDPTMRTVADATQLISPPSVTAFSDAASQAAPIAVGQTAAKPGMFDGLVDDPLKWMKENPYKTMGAVIGGGLLLDKLAGGNSAMEDAQNEKRADTKGAWRAVRGNYRAVGRPSPWNEYYYKKYGLTMADGGPVPAFPMQSGGFVMTNKAVKGAGRGDEQKGLAALKRKHGAKAIRGKGTGTSDSVPAVIDGKVPARLSNGEAYIPPEKVKKAGGAQRMMAEMKRLQSAKAGAKKAKRYAAGGDVSYENTSGAKVTGAVTPNMLASAFNQAAKGKSFAPKFAAPSQGQFRGLGSLMSNYSAQGPAAYRAAQQQARTVAKRNGAPTAGPTGPTPLPKTTKVDWGNLGGTYNVPNIYYPELDAAYNAFVQRKGRTVSPERFMDVQGNNILYRLNGFTAPPTTTKVNRGNLASASGVPSVYYPELDSAYNAFVQRKGRTVSPEQFMNQVGYNYLNNGSNTP